MRFAKFFQRLFAGDHLVKCLHITAKLSGKILIAVFLDCKNDIMKSLFPFLFCGKSHQLCIENRCHLPLFFLIRKHTDNGSGIHLSPVKSVKELFSQPQDFAEENPQSGRTEAESPSGNILPSKWDEGISSDKRPSVREALKQIRQEQAGTTEQPQHTIAEKVVEKIAKGKER